MKTTILLIIILLTGCATTSKLPVYYPDQDTMKIRMFLYETPLDISVRFPQKGFVRGLQYHKHGFCYIHVIAGDHEAIAHEVAHCFYGSFHE